MKRTSPFKRENSTITQGQFQFTNIDDLLKFRKIIKSSKDPAVKRYQSTSRIPKKSVDSNKQEGNYFLPKITGETVNQLENYQINQRFLYNIWGQSVYNLFINYLL